MTTLQSIILGVIEGLTEFLPVSSTGHLILAKEWLGVAEGPTWNTFVFVSQIGAILAVVIYFWRDLWRRFLPDDRPYHLVWPAIAHVGDLLRRVWRAPLDAWKRHIAVKLAVAFAPSVGVGLAVNDFMEAYLENNAVAVACALLIGAGLIEWIDRRFRRVTPMELEDVTLKQAFIVGLCQCLAVIPGTSRAGATIMGGMAAGLSPKVATEFSFYLAIPTMFAAGGYRLLKHYDELRGDSAGVILLGTAVAFIVAWVVVAAFMGFVKRYRFTVFAVYRVLLGALVLAAYFLHWI